MDEHKQSNGNTADPFEDTVIDWPEPVRRPWWRTVTARAARAMAGEVQARGPSTATLLGLIGLFTWSMGLTLTGVYLGGRMSRAIEEHDAAVIELRAAIKENAGVRRDLEDARTKLKELYTYETNLREKMASGQYRLRDLPPVPETP